MRWDDSEMHSLSLTESRDCYAARENRPDSLSQRANTDIKANRFDTSIDLPGCIIQITWYKSLNASGFLYKACAVTMHTQNNIDGSLASNWRLRRSLHRSNVYQKASEKNAKDQQQRYKRTISRNQYTHILYKYAIHQGTRVGAINSKQARKRKQERDDTWDIKPQPMDRLGDISYTHIYTYTIYTRITPKNIYTYMYIQNRLEIEIKIVFVPSHFFPFKQPAAVVPLYCLAYATLL